MLSTKESSLTLCGKILVYSSPRSLYESLLDPVVYGECLQNYVYFSNANLISSQEKLMAKISFLLGAINMFLFHYQEPERGEYVISPALVSFYFHTHLNICNMN